MNTYQYINPTKTTAFNLNDGRGDEAENKINQPVGLTDKFKYGDIIYGLDAPRDVALKNISAAGFKRKEAVRPKVKNLLVTIRQSFRKPKEKVNIIIQNDITNAVWDPVTPTQYSDDKKLAKVLNDPARASEFRQFIALHKNYNVKEQSLIAQQRGEQLDAKDMWKKTSKAGLEYQLLNRKKPLHFVVDIIGDDIGTVASKEGHGTSITSSELRWLYRHRYLPEVRSNLIFYRGGVQIPHDEIFANEGWSNYHPKNQYRP